jgi:hypothetical protein
VLCFYEFLTPFTLGAHNIFNFISFLTIFSALEAPIGGVQVLFENKNNGALPLDMACPKWLSVIVVVQLQLNLQLKNN